MANPSTSTVDAAASCRATKLTCLCSPTNHPGSFRCSRHRSPRARPPSSVSLSGRASQQQAAAPGMTWRDEGMKSVGGRATKGRSVLRAHLQRLVSPPSSGGHEHRRCRDFKPRLSRLGRLAVNACAPAICSASLV